MFKRITISILTLLTAVMLFGCLAGGDLPMQNTPDAQTNPNADTQTPEPDDMATPEAAMQSDTEGETQLQLLIKQKTVTVNATDITLVIINGSDKNFTYDYVQRLERKSDNGTWQPVSLTNEAVSLALLTIPAGETQEQTFDFANHYDTLTHGTYRIVKTFVDEAGMRTDVSCEFDAF